MADVIFNSVYDAFCNVGQNIVNMTQPIVNYPIVNRSIQASQRVFDEINLIRLDLSYGIPTQTVTIFTPNLRMPRIPSTRLH